MPSLAPNTAARNQPMRWLISIGHEGATEADTPLHNQNLITDRRGNITVLDRATHVKAMGTVAHRR